MYGSQIARELAKRRFETPNPGTIYPALKAMQKDGLIKVEGKGAKKTYKLTRKGRDGLKDASRYFVQVYAEIVDDYRTGKI